MKKLASFGTLLLLCLVVVSAIPYCDDFRINPWDPWGGGGYYYDDCECYPLPQRLCDDWPTPPDGDDDPETPPCVMACVTVPQECACDTLTAETGQICYYDNEEEEYVVEDATSYRLFSCYNNFLYHDGEYPDGDGDRFFNFDRISNTALFPDYGDFYLMNRGFRELMDALEAGALPNRNDCDDNNPDVNPDAVENPDTDYDDNCDGYTTEEPDIEDESYQSSEAILVGYDGSQMRYHVCGDGDVELVDFDFSGADAGIEQYFIYHKICETVTVQTETGTLEFRCAPISDSGAQFYRWEDISTNPDGIYEDVPFFGVGTDTYTNDFAAGARAWYTDAEQTGFNQDVPDDDYPIRYTIDTMQCIGDGQINEIDADNDDLNVDVIIPAGIASTDELEAGIDTNQLRLLAYVNTGGLNIDLKTLSYSLGTIGDGGAFTQLFEDTVCDDEAAGQGGGGGDDACTTNANCGWSEHCEDGICLPNNPDAEPEETPECELEGEEVTFYLSKGLYGIELTGVDEDDIERTARIRVLVNAEGQYSPDYSEQGSCAQQTQCFLGYDTENRPECVDSGYYFEDNLCISDGESSEWATRTGVIASTLKQFADTLGTPYALDCNDKTKAVNAFADYGQPEGTNFCVLNVYEDGKVAQTIIGVGLVESIEDPTNEIVSILDGLDIGVVETQGGDTRVTACDTILSETDDRFFYCSGDELWYYPNLKIALFSKEDINLDDGGSSSMVDSIFDFFGNLFGEPPSAEWQIGTPPISKKANIIYYAKGETPKEIYGSIEHMNYAESDETVVMRKTLTLVTHGFDDLCARFAADPDNFDPDDYNCYHEPGPDKVQYITTKFGASDLKDMTIPLVFY